MPRIHDMNLTDLNDAYAIELSDAEVNELEGTSLEAMTEDLERHYARADRRQRIDSQMGRAARQLMR